MTLRSLCRYLIFGSDFEPREGVWATKELFTKHSGDGSKLAFRTRAMDRAEADHAALVQARKRAGTLPFRKRA